MDKLDVVIMGVGGQGTLMASRVLGHIAQQLNYDVKVSEVHGMSQRGGSVITYVRMNKKAVYSPLIEQKGADFLLAFEELEALRALPYLKENGTAIVNTQQILPLPVIIGAAQYPSDILETLSKNTNLKTVDAMPLARKAGSERAVNVVLLGMLAGLLPFEKAVWEAALHACIPEKFITPNLEAFSLGLKQIKQV